MFKKKDIKKILILFGIICLFRLYCDYTNREGFFNIGKRYKKAKKGVSKNLESMIGLLPEKVNLKKNVLNLKRKIIS